jgi:hypothetical protein
MAEESDKRSEGRNTCDADIEWAYFNKSDVHAARLLNISQSGGYFECSHPIIPGATILIRLHKSMPGPPAEPEATPLRTAALGEVKWCRELAGRRSIAYGIGIRYHLPV